MQVIVVGGNGPPGAVATLARLLVKKAQQRGRTVAVIVAVREADCDTRVQLFLAPRVPSHRTEIRRIVAEGAHAVVALTVTRAEVRRGLAAALRTARTLYPATVVIASTDAGTELKGHIDSWFVSSGGPWEPSAHRHRNRANHVVSSDAVFAEAHEAAL